MQGHEHVGKATFFLREFEENTILGDEICCTYPVELLESFQEITLTQSEESPHHVKLTFVCPVPISHTLTLSGS